MKFTLRETILLSLSIAFVCIGTYQLFFGTTKANRIDAYIFFMLGISAIFIFRLQQKAPSKEETKKNLNNLRKKKR